jgi:hypothetical protein
MTMTMMMVVGDEGDKQALQSGKQTPCLVLWL